MSKQNVPELRIDGFEGEWDSSEFGDIASRSTLFSDTPQLPRVEYEDIHSGLGILNKDLRAKQSTKVGIYFQPGDVLYGKLRPYLKNWLLSDFEGIAVGDFWVLRSRAAAPHFIYTLIQTNRFSEAASISSGSKMPRADWTLVSQTQLPAPPTVEEQQAIGAVFTKLDATTTSHRKKLDLLKQTKTSLLQRMFPQDGATVPELRLDGFEGKWDSVTLGDVGKLHTGYGFPESQQNGVNGIPFYKVSDMNLLGNEREMLRANHYVESDQITRQGWRPVFDVPAILFAKVGAAIFLGRKRLVRSPFLMDNNMMAYSIEEGEWVTSFAQTVFDHLDLSTLVQTGSLPSINPSAVKALEVKTPPTVEEQRAIGAVFSKLDALISAEAQYIDKLTQTKAALLQKMFV